ncbi:MAG: threonine--tRNA ligase [bacterium]|nr:threonine--tRNA ligase [bacterium]
MSKLENGGDIEAVRHSLAHLLAAAVLKKYPKAKLGIGPVIENGFYYDFLIVNQHESDHESSRIKEEDLQEFEDEMRIAIKVNLEFTGEKITPAKAKTLFKDQPFKLELIKDFVKEKKELTAYKTGDIFLDLCRGGHAKNTSEINPEAFKLTHVAGAYWKGSEKNPQMQRIYGLAFETKEELEAYLKMRVEAEKRDHKKLGPELDLFTFSELVGAGLPLWTPKGTLLRNLLDDYVWELRKARGYEQVDIPHITKKDLYEISGHWAKFKNELFKIETREKHLFVMKPMNCPHHTQIYARKPWSYREIPQRYASTTKVYRDEQSGELAGLSRVRAITQDDAHVFCRSSQVKEEAIKIWDIIQNFYGTFGFKLTLRLSLHDPAQAEKYLGDKKTWQTAEAMLHNIVREKHETAMEAIGEAAFYGPKLDFMAKDSLGREWQVATIQLDMNMPERFDLTCVNEKGEQERIVMIHAAIMGSIERFLAILIEHYAGAFPLWLAPVQTRILAISEKQNDYAEKILIKLKEAGIRAEKAPTDETLGKRIRATQTEKIPYTLIVGDKEIENSSVSLRHLTRGDEGTMSIDELVKKLTKEIADKT